MQKRPILNGDYSRAETQYKAEAAKAPEDPQLQFNLGTASYKNGKYDEALNAFQAALNVQEIALQNKAYYNMGNALYRQGQATEKSNPRDTIRKWENALQAYEGALKLDSKDQDAIFNRDFVKKRLEELKKQQKQNQKPDQKPNQNQDQKDQNKNNKQSASQDKDKNKAPNKDQNKEKDGKDKNQSASQDKDKKDQDGKNSGQNPEQDKKSAQNQQNKNASAKQDKVEPRNSNGETPAPARAERRRRPGQMTQEQAQNLLDSLKGDDQSMPMVADNKNAGKAAREKERRDW